jgi:hypothetical protein
MSTNLMVVFQHLSGSDFNYLSDGFYTCLVVSPITRYISVVGSLVTCLVAGFTEKMSRKRM